MKTPPIISKCNPKDKNRNNALVSTTLLCVEKWAGRILQHDTLKKLPVETTLHVYGTKYETNTLTSRPYAPTRRQGTGEGEDEP